MLHTIFRVDTVTSGGLLMCFARFARFACCSGDPVYDSYGPKCNSRFFVNYGFALEQNDENQCVIPIAVCIV
jgi:hypothetical protein